MVTKDNSILTLATLTMTLNLDEKSCKTWDNNGQYFVFHRELGFLHVNLSIHWYLCLCIVHVWPFSPEVGNYFHIKDAFLIASWGKFSAQKHYIQETVTKSPFIFFEGGYEYLYLNNTAGQMRILQKHTPCSYTSENFKLQNVILSTLSIKIICLT